LTSPNVTRLREPADKTGTALLALIFVVVAAAGLAYVKWWPYYHKAIAAITDHTIGSSILAGTGKPFTWSGAWDYAVKYFKAVWKAAVLGILLGSLVQVLLPARWLQRQLGQATFRSTLKGGISSLPGMMCTCCAAPIAAGLRRRQASVGAALAFWIGNPVLNPATLIFMTFVLSWKFTLIRLVFGVLLTFGVSMLAGRFAADAGAPEPAASAIGTEKRGEDRPFVLRWARSLGALLLQVVPAYVLTVVLLGGLQGFLFPTSAGLGGWAVPLFALAGTLFVIPTAAEIPIIQGFLALGVGNGPASALLLTLPAVSLPSLLMVAKSFPRKAIAFVFVAVVVIGIVSGWTGALLLG
jgi:hypothetical protein